MMDFVAAKEFILDKLKTGLKPDLYYHCYNHTLDVYESAIKLAKLEKIDKKGLMLLKTAALYHDSGFLLGYKDHEDCSAKFSKTHLPKFGYTAEDIDIICGMILITKLPQQPKTILQKILCDADLDYLGRDDFFMIANQLLCEWNVNGIPTTLKKWYHIQVDFLSNNNYFTRSAKKLRVEKKKKNLSEIQNLLTVN
ncbi:MAG: HD domain-containing protein [Bacteroidales bacterium]|jgi:predicted metal-dependent HD superfamily phosphohydrolase